MLFVELRFFVFFVIVLGVHWALRSNTWRQAWLLICSHFFYACFFICDSWTFGSEVQHHEPLPEGWSFPFVLVGSTCMDFLVGLRIGDARTERTRQRLLLVSVLPNLGCALRV